MYRSLDRRSRQPHAAGSTRRSPVLGMEPCQSLGSLHHSKQYSPQFARSSTLG